MKCLQTTPCKVTREMNEKLMAPYSAEEVKRALFQMFPTKAPSYDGFPVNCFQQHWEICGSEVTKMVLRIVEGVESATKIKKTILVLISKVKKSTLLAIFPY